MCKLGGKASALRYKGGGSSAPGKQCVPSRRTARPACMSLSVVQLHPALLFVAWMTEQERELIKFTADTMLEGL